MRLKLFLLGLLVWFSGLAQEAPRPASLTGEVINEVTGEPLIRATVQFTRSPSDKPQKFGALTNAEGRFSVAEVPAGEYTAVVTRVGFVAPRDTVGSTRNPIVVGPGEKKTDVKLKLIPVGAITGRVLDSEGQPVESISVVAEDGASGETRSGQTDDEGRFRIGGLRPGKYRVKTSDRGNSGLPPEVRTDGTTDFHYGPTYYPNSLDERQAGRVDVKAGAETGGVEIVLVRMPIVRLSGRVIGIPPGTGKATLFVRRGSHGEVKANGSFELWRLPPGPIDLNAWWEGPGGQRQTTAPVVVEVGSSNIDNIELRIVPRADIVGQVTFEEEESVKTNQQQPKQVTQTRQLILTELDGYFSDRPVTIGPDGAFRLERVQAGRYRATVTGGGVYVKSMRVGMTEIEGSILDLTNGFGSEPLAVTASPLFGAISGTVSDSQGVVAGMTVVLTPDNPKVGLLPQLTATSSMGSYTFDSIPPGKYKLVAVEESDIHWASKGKGLDSYKDTIEDVEVEAKGKISKDLKRRGSDRN